MKTSHISLDELISNYCQHLSGACISLYVTPPVKKYLNSIDIKTHLYTLCVLRFKTANECSHRYNEMILTTNLNPVMWINGTKS